MNRNQWTEGRKYEKIPEPTMEWEIISPEDPRYAEMLQKAISGGLVVVGENVMAAKWEEHVPQKPRLI